MPRNFSSQRYIFANKKSFARKICKLSSFAAKICIFLLGYKNAAYNTSFAELQFRINWQNLIYREDSVSFYFIFINIASFMCERDTLRAQNSIPSLRFFFHLYLLPLAFTNSHICAKLRHLLPPYSPPSLLPLRFLILLTISKISFLKPSLFLALVRRVCY